MPVGIRQTINEKPGMSAGVTAGVIVLALVFILWESFGHHGAARPPAQRTFYSDDDGQTWFPDASNKVTPFTDANSKEAVQAFIFKCGDGQPFCGYLLRATDEGRKEAAGQPHGVGSVILLHSEVKKPGGKTWVKFDPRNTVPFTSITQSFPNCPVGSKPDPVLPPP
jgi:hypothetical protein